MGLDERPQQPALRQFGGLNVRDSELGLPGSDSPYMINTDLHPHGSIRMRSGTSALTTPGSETMIEAIMQLEQPEQSRGWIYAIGNNSDDPLIYRTADPGTWVWLLPTMDGDYELTTQQWWGRARSRYYDGTTEHPSVLYIPRSNGAPIIALGQDSLTEDLISHPDGAYGDGTADSGTTGYPSTWGADHWPTAMRVVGVGRGSRMHAWGLADDPNKVYYTELDVPWNYLRSNVDYPGVSAQPLIDGGYYWVERGDGDKIISVVDMFSYTVIFKKHRTFIYTGDPGDVNGWRLHHIFPVGCVSDRAWVKVGNDILFWSEDGPRSLSAVQEHGDLSDASLSGKISSLVKAIVPSSFERICGYHDALNQRVVWFIPLAGSNHNDTAYVFYYGTNSWAKWNGAATEVKDVIKVTADSTNVERFIAGTFDNGIVLLHSGFDDVDLDIADTDDLYSSAGLANIAQDYYTNWINAGEISDVARVMWLDVIAGDEGPQVDIYYQTDLNTEWVQVQRIIKSIGGAGMQWGKFAWPDAAWGTVSRAMRRYEMDTNFNFIRFRFSVSGSYGFEIMGYRPELRIKGPHV